MKDSDRKFYLANVTDRFVRGEMDRRSFLRAAGKLGLGATALGMGMGSRPTSSGLPMKSSPGSRMSASRLPGPP